MYALMNHPYFKFVISYWGCVIQTCGFMPESSQVKLVKLYRNDSAWSLHSTATWKSLTCFSLHLAEVELDSMNFPEWLPNLFRVLPWMNGDYDELYVLFRKILLNHNPAMKGFRMVFSGKENGKEKYSDLLLEMKNKLENVYQICEVWTFTMGKAMLDHVGYSEELAWDIKRRWYGKDLCLLEQCDSGIVKKISRCRRRLITSMDWNAHTKRSLGKSMSKGFR